MSDVRTVQDGACGYTIVGERIYKARIVGVDESENLVVLLEDETITAHRLPFLYRTEHEAKKVLELKSITKA